ncbi:MAG: hypothetical protein KJP21_08000 [Bacteroidia bacterium]|nr:hypothetical protein [Bacteroidia bacterium]
MKHVILLLFITTIGLVSCKKEPCITDSKCKEYPAKDEPCDAYFQRWFYDAKLGDCYLKGYSGCEAYGFATEEECDKCDCKDEKEYVSKGK